MTKDVEGIGQLYVEAKIWEVGAAALKTVLTVGATGATIVLAVPTTISVPFVGDIEIATCLKTGNGQVMSL